MATRWHKRGADPAQLKALHPGVPSWLERYLMAWVKVVGYEGSDYPYGTGRKPNLGWLLEYETAVRRPESLLEQFSNGGPERLLREMGPAEFLDFVDFLLHKVTTERGSEGGWSDKLEEILSDAGSEWRVGTRDDFVSLEKRVPDGVALAAAETIANSDDAGVLLAEAWHAAFGRSPDAEEAYEKAIKAVEEAGTDKVSPKNEKATLGSMVRDMRAQKDWAIAFGPSHGNVAVQMAEALWVDQESRHGGNGYRKPTQAEAEAAVLLAVPLVQWFSSDALARRS